MTLQNILGRLRRSILILGVLATAPAMPAGAETIRMEEIQLGGPKDGVCNLHGKGRTTNPAHQGVIWYIEAGAKRLGRLDLTTGEVLKFDLPAVPSVGYTTDSLDTFPGNDSVHGPCDPILLDDGTIWFNYQLANAVGYMDVSSPDTMQLLTMPTPRSLPMAMQVGGDGNIYLQLTAVDKIARINPTTHEITEFALPHTGSSVIGGAPDRAGNAHWFITMRTNRLIRFDYATYVMEEFEIPTPNAAPFVIRALDDGLWFTMFEASAIGHFDPATRQFTEIPLPTPDSGPIGIVEGADGDLYANLAKSDRIARIDRTTRRVIAEYPIPTGNSFPVEIKQGPDGAIWVPQYLSGKIARLWLSSFGEDPGFPQKDE